MFLVLRMQQFELEQPPNFPYPITIETGKQVGYLPVYLTREDALTDFPDTPLMEIQEVAQIRCGESR